MLDVQIVIHFNMKNINYAILNKEGASSKQGWLVGSPARY